LKEAARNNPEELDEEESDEEEKDLDVVGRVEIIPAKPPSSSQEGENQSAAQ